MGARSCCACLLWRARRSPDGETVRALTPIVEAITAAARIRVRRVIVVLLVEGCWLGLSVMFCVANKVCVSFLSFRVVFFFAKKSGNEGEFESRVSLALLSSR